MQRNRSMQSYLLVKCKYAANTMKVIAGSLAALLVFAFLFGLCEYAVAQEQANSVLRARAEAIIHASKNLVPQEIEAEIKFFDRSGRQTRSESGTIILQLLPDGSIQSTYTRKYGPPSGGPPGGRPPGGGPSSGGPPGEGKMQMKQPSEEEIEKISDLTDGNWVLELTRLINPFSPSDQKEINFESEPTLIMDHGKECTSFPFVLRQDGLTVKGDMAVANSTGTPSKCTATLYSNKGKRNKVVVVFLYTYEQDTHRVYPSEITLVETIKKGLLGFRTETLSCRYKLRNFSYHSNE